MELMARRRELLIEMARTMGIFEKLEVVSLTITGLPSVSANLSNYSFTVQHSLGVVPDYVMLYPKQRMAPPDSTPDKDIRILQMAICVNIGGRLQSNAYTDNGQSLFTRLYTNTNGAKYYQWSEYAIDSGLINTLTSQSVQIGGKSIPNTGLYNGDYWVLIGKIASQYQQGQQVIYSE